MTWWKRITALLVTFSLCMLMAAPSQLAHAGSGSITAAKAADVNAAELKTASESEVAYAGVSLIAWGNTYGYGWGAKTGANSVIGDTAGKGLRAFAITLTNLQGLDGGISYQTYQRNEGWKTLVSNGKSTGTVRNVEALKIKLTGSVSKHYDVLYRTYVSGKGWQKWVKNGASSGIVKSNVRVNAVQVKLSAKTMEAYNAKYTTNTVGVRYEGRLQKSGWQSWTGSGKTAGTTGKSKALCGLAVKADAGSLSGGVKYRAHVSNNGWQAWKTNGSFAGDTSQQLEAVSVQLTGALSNTYDVYYRAHVKDYGWLDWAKNGAEAGSTGFSLRLEAFQVKLVKKGGEAPGPTSYTTVNELEKSRSLNGIDISSWQSDINLYNVSADFVIVKATQGNWYTNPYFTAHATDTLASGKLLGAYHFADLEGSAVSQADYFVSRVRPYIGQCVLVLDWEADALSLGPSWAKRFLNRVYKKTGVKPLIYLSQSVTWEHDWSSVASKYKLWLAQYLYANMYTGYLDSPSYWEPGYWSSVTIYQYSSTGQLSGYGSNLDINKFYGGISSWRELCAKS